jgi:hypothetical protein
MLVQKHVGDAPSVFVLIKTVHLCGVVQYILKKNAQNGQL